MHGIASVVKLIYNTNRAVESLTLFMCRVIHDARNIQPQFCSNHQAATATGFADVRCANLRHHPRSAVDGFTQRHHNRIQYALGKD